MTVLVVTAMYPTPENPAFGSFVSSQVKALRQEGVDIELLVLAGRNRKLIYPRGIMQMQRRLAIGGIDLVHAHYGYVGFVARSQCRVPVVVTYHGDDVMGRRDLDGNITRFTRITSAACRWLAQHVDVAIVQSAAMAARVRGAKVHIVPHEVDLDVFCPMDRVAMRRALGLDPHRKYLLFAADPEIAVKRFPMAKAVTDKLKAEDPSVELLVVYREAQPRLAQFFCASDVLVFPSFQEGSPNVVKQAMACNLPVVSTNVGDVAEVISNTRGCYICPSDVDSFASAIRQILVKRERTRGRDAVLHLAPRLVARKITGIYQDVLRQGRRWNERQAA